MTNRIKQVVFPVLAAATLALLVTSAQPSSAAVKAADAKSLYAQQCAACHALDGSGNTAAGKKMNVRAFNTPEVQKLTDAKLLEIITKGKDKMPAFGSKNSAEDNKQLAAYVRSLGKK
ncbi:MAG: cytochrome c [Acidobacteria bacterium]|nr:cytochrome c [Acidobacteriota bacterium]MBI3422613.1 cytochrome c [Acidobacteriota bacterium]